MKEGPGRQTDREPAAPTLIWRTNHQSGDIGTWYDRVLGRPSNRLCLEISPDPPAVEPRGRVRLDPDSPMYQRCTTTTVNSGEQQGTTGT
jgi:hypothetical protein